MKKDQLAQGDLQVLDVVSEPRSDEKLFPPSTVLLTRNRTYTFQIRYNGVKLQNMSVFPREKATLLQEKYGSLNTVA